MSITVLRDGNEATLTLDCGELPVDDAIRSAGHEPNGYFWESIASYVCPQLDLDHDPEANTFITTGLTNEIDTLATALEPLTRDPEQIQNVIAAAEAAGCEFDD